MPYYPVYLNLTGRKVLVVGGGSVACRKIDTLLDYGASVSVVAREMADSLKNNAEGGLVKYLGKEFNENMLDGIFLVIAATDDAGLNHEISMAAEKRNMLVNAVDQPADCNFIVPSIVKKGDLTIAVSTSGKSPTLAKKIRKELSSGFGDEYEAFLKLMGHIRHQVLGEGRSQKENSIIFKKIVYSEILDQLRGNNLEKAAALLSEILGKEITSGDIDYYLRN